MDYNYQSIENMDPQYRTGTWRKFSVFLTGNTNGAHQPLVEKLRHYGHKEVGSPDDCDYLLVFCPAVSRVQSDIVNGLSRIPGTWRKFSVFLTGNTNGAHQPLVEKLRHYGHKEVGSPDDCDYLLVFCPAVSRVQSDIVNGLSRIPVVCPLSSDKPIILVVMHHTFDPSHMVAESRRQVMNPKVRLTVDYLFFQNDLLPCKLNDYSWGAIQRFLQFPITQESDQSPNTWMRKERIIPAVLVIVLIAVFVMLLTYFLLRSDKNPE